MIDKHRSLIGDREELAASSQDASRLMARGQKGERRDPTRLLREEKMRKRIAKELPKVEADLRRALEDWEDEYGRPFCVKGERYLDELAAINMSSTQSSVLPPRSKTPSAPPQPRTAAPEWLVLRLPRSCDREAASEVHLRRDQERRHRLVRRDVTSTVVVPPRSPRP